MPRPNTGRVVTAVEDVQTIRDWANESGIDVPVRVDQSSCPIGTAADTEFAIATTGGACHPYPALPQFRAMVR
jgi:hypothetical protein